MPLYEQHAYSERFQRAHIDNQFDVFLSYNIADLNIVKGIYYTLSKMGFRVYLDCLVDPEIIRSETDKNTAKRLQTRLKNSKSLIYAQSIETGKSNWMPWELGFVDGHTGKYMIMPVTKDAKPINSKREYLLLYPYVILSEVEEKIKVLTETYPYMREDLVSYIMR